MRYLNLFILICIFTFTSISLIKVDAAQNEIASGFFSRKNVQKESTNQKISPLITSTIERIESEVLTKNKSPESLSSTLVKVNEEGYIQTYVYVTEVNDQVISELEDNGMRIDISNEKYKIIQGWIHFDQINSISELEFVIKITPPGYTKPRTGSVNTQGDAVMKSDQVRNNLGITGEGVFIGVISTGITNVASSMATGDLPDNIATNPMLLGIEDDEGTAMLEIIHDIAPGASLAFCGPTTSIEFISCIDFLLSIGVDVIVDDLGLYDQPFFEDGPVALEARSAVQSGVVFVSAAGNDALEHYQADYIDINPEDNINNFHDFGAAGGIGSIDGILALIPPNKGTNIILQWSDPFGQSSNNYDLFVLPVVGTTILCAPVSCTSIMIQDGTQDPVEIVTVGNTSLVDPLIIAIVINKFSGLDQTLEMYFNIFVPPPFELQPNLNVSSDSIFGHPAVEEVIAVGAVPFFDPFQVEEFSSQGPSTIFFPNFEEREKPDVVAPDNVSITGAGGFGGGTFLGTSAAAPHVAGVAALILEASPLLTPAQVQNILRTTAIDVSPNGIKEIIDIAEVAQERIFNPVAGFGLVDALAAVESILPIGDDDDDVVGDDDDDVVGDDDDDNDDMMKIIKLKELTVFILKLSH